MAEGRGGSRWTEENVERLAVALWAYEGDPEVPWDTVAGGQPGVRLRAKAAVLLGVVFDGRGIMVGDENAPAAQERPGADTEGSAFDAR